MREIIEKLQKQIDEAIECNQPLNEASWGYEQGVIITVNEAKEILEILSSPKREECITCKHWGGQGIAGSVIETIGDDKTCMAYLFGDLDNKNFKQMPNWVVTFGSLNGAKGVLKTHKNFGCVNHNPLFD
jgi:hypothetical protein